MTSAVLTAPARAKVLAPVPTPERLRTIPWGDLLIVAGVAVFAAMIVSTNLHGYPTVQDDEGTYLSQAEWVRAHGQLAPYTYWYDHPPLGWIQIALFSWIPGFHAGSLTVASGRGIMVLYAAASAALVYLVALRAGMRRIFAVGAVWLFVCSPLSMTFLRQVYLDNLALPWLLGAFYFAYNPRSSLWRYIAAGALAAGAVLTKETTAVMLPGVALAGWQSSTSKTRTFAFVGFYSALLFGCLAYPLMAVLKNELFAGPRHVSLQSAMEFQFFKRAGSGSIFDPTSSAHGTVMGWVHLDRWLLVMGLAGGVLSLCVRRLRPLALALLMLVVTILRKGYLPQMFVIAALPLLAMCAAGAADQLWSLTGGRRWFLTWPGRSVIAAGVIVCVSALTVAWEPSYGNAFTVDNNVEHAEAVAYIRQSPIPRSSRIVVDNTMWQDMVHAGFPSPWHAIWYYKIDLDSEAEKQLPQGWRSVNYIVLTPFMRQDIQTLGLKQMQAAVTHSRVVATFGTGDTAVELRQVVVPRTSRSGG